jgi:nucleotide-binding universal stress UspA family protein/molybdopterin converting factor small subunit
LWLAALGGSRLLTHSSTKEGPKKNGQVVQPISITIKVVYFGMSTQMTGSKEEYLTLASPVHLDNVLTQIKQEHAVLAAMLPVMQIVVNGVPTQDNLLLQDKTEVDLIPIYAGGSSQFEFSKILVAVDGSENAKRALEVAVRLSRDYHSKLIILNAVLIDKYGIQHSRYTEEDSQRIVNQALSIAREGFAERGILASGEVKRANSSIVETIIETASEEKADLIVLGTRGLGSFKKLLLGSVSNGVVTHAHCNVLVVR